MILPGYITSSFPFQNNFCSYINFVSRCFFLSAICFFSSCSSDNNSVQESVALDSLYVGPTIVTIAKVQKGPFYYPISSGGKIFAIPDISFFSETAGVVKKINVGEGTIVNANETVLTVADTSLKIKIQRAKLSKYNAEKEYESMLLGYESSFKTQNQQQIEQIKRKLQFTSGLSIAELDIKDLEIELAKYKVHAPFTGIVTDLKVQEFETIRQNQFLFRIYNPSNMKIQMQVMEDDLKFLKTGQTGFFSVAGSPDLIKCQVGEIKPFINESGFAEINIEISGKYKSIVPGQHCQVQINICIGEAVMVPKEAIVYRGGNPVVFTFENGLAKWNSVKIGKDNGKQVEILEGLNTNQFAIVTNNLQLSNDANVSVNNDPKEVKQ